jgi:hypothetical protein
MVSGSDFPLNQSIKLWEDHGIQEVGYNMQISWDGWDGWDVKDKSIIVL